MKTNNIKKQDVQEKMTREEDGRGLCFQVSYFICGFVCGSGPHSLGFCFVFVHARQGSGFGLFVWWLCVCLFVWGLLVVKL